MTNQSDKNEQNEKGVSRRNVLKWFGLGVAAVPILSAEKDGGGKREAVKRATHEELVKNSELRRMRSKSAKVDTSQKDVLMTRDISAEGLLAIYRALEHPAKGNVAVKISSGEPGGHHFLSPNLIADLVNEVKGTIVECNTAYFGMRSTTILHERVMESHGFKAIAAVDIMDADGSMSLPIEGGIHLTEDLVGKNFGNYDFVVNLAHFKGHTMGGFGGVIKNMSIGIASVEGKCLIHTAGVSRETMMNGDHDDFLESMAEAAKGVADYLGENIVYINVMNFLSVDCDCDSSPAKPTMADIGILASLDPVALDQACVDLIYAAEDGADLIERIESRNGQLTLAHAEEIGLGSRQYQLIDIDQA
jgi:uncharacterized Fe-S center protein